MAGGGAPLSLNIQHNAPSLSSISGPLSISARSGLNLGETIKSLESMGPPENGGWGVVGPSGDYGSGLSSSLGDGTLQAGLLGGFGIEQVVLFGVLGLVGMLIATRFAR